MKTCSKVKAYLVHNPEKIGHDDNVVNEHIEKIVKNSKRKDVNEVVDIFKINQNERDYKNTISNHRK